MAGGILGYPPIFKMAASEDQQAVYPTDPPRPVTLSTMHACQMETKWKSLSLSLFPDFFLSCLLSSLLSIPLSCLVFFLCLCSSPPLFVCNQNSWHNPGSKYSVAQPADSKDGGARSIISVTWHMTFQFECYFRDMAHEFRVRCIVLLRALIISIWWMKSTVTQIIRDTDRNKLDTHAHSGEAEDTI
jgi:hypothetical protein